MDSASLYYLGTTVILCALFAGIVFRLCRRDRRESVEAAKYRMMDHD